jgi:hypothetical protein
LQARRNPLRFVAAGCARGTCTVPLGKPTTSSGA